MHAVLGANVKSLVFDCFIDFMLLVLDGDVKKLSHSQSVELIVMSFDFH